LVAAIGLNLTVSYLRLHFRKEPVPMRIAAGGTAWSTIPQRVGDHWVQLPQGESLGEDLLKALGTDQYLFVNYVNARAVGGGKTPEEIRSEFGAKSPKDQNAQLGKYRSITRDGAV